MRFQSQASTTAAVFPRPVGIVISRDSHRVPCDSHVPSVSPGAWSPQASRFWYSYGPGGWPVACRKNSAKFMARGEESSGGWDNHRPKRPHF